MSTIVWLRFGLFVLLFHFYKSFPTFSSFAPFSFTVLIGYF